MVHAGTIRIQSLRQSLLRKTTKTSETTRPCSAAPTARWSPSWEPLSVLMTCSYPHRQAHPTTLLTWLPCGLHGWLAGLHGGLCIVVLHSSEARLNMGLFVSGLFTECADSTVMLSGFVCHVVHRQNSARRPHALPCASQPSSATGAARRSRDGCAAGAHGDG